MKANDYSLAELTTEQFAQFIESDKPVVILLPVGVMEPHGPHLPLITDTVISHHAAIRAANILEKNQVIPLIAPPVHYGVTDCASAFKGAVSILSETLTSYLRDVINAFLKNGVAHVCVINNHLEPAQFSAINNSIKGIETGNASVACPLTKRWARTLSDEFKRGECHAGEYETSIMMSATPDLVDDQKRLDLPEVPVSLSKKINAGISDFAEMGLSRAYSGAPANATESHGSEMLDKLAEMVATEVLEAMGMK